MNRTILYYPTIDIPNGSWLRYALLYWDEIASIIPESIYESYQFELSPEIQYLIGEGQFRKVLPESLITESHNVDLLSECQKEFIEKLSSRGFQTLLRRRGLEKFSIHVDKFNPNSTVRVHRNKTSENIIDHLIKNGLLIRYAAEPEWLYFEKNTALLYMSLLAKYLAEIDSQHMTIGTDLPVYEGFNFTRVNSDAGSPVLNISLNKLIPTPRSDVPLERIINFKRRRADNLLHFNTLISNFQRSCSRAESQAELKLIIVEFQESLRYGIRDLHFAMVDSRIEARLKSFKSLISLPSAISSAAVGVLYNRTSGVFDFPLAVEIGGIIAGGAIDLGINYIKFRNIKRNLLRESPFSYVLRAQRLGFFSAAGGHHPSF
jgi:hypothetical protein